MDKCLPIQRHKFEIKMNDLVINNKYILSLLDEYKIKKRAGKGNRFSNDRYLLPQKARWQDTLPGMCRAGCLRKTAQ